MAHASHVVCSNDAQGLALGGFDSLTRHFDLMVTTANAAEPVAEVFYAGCVCADGRMRDVENVMRMMSCVIDLVRLSRDV